MTNFKSNTKNYSHFPLIRDISILKLNTNKISTIVTLNLDLVFTFNNLLPHVHL